MGKINNDLNSAKTKILDSSVDRELKLWQINNGKSTIKFELTFN